MKNKKLVIVAFMLVAVMLLGVGYAALTDTLIIIGNAHIDIDTTNATFDERIYFTNSEATSSTGTGTKADVASHSDDDATFTANKLALVGEKSIFTFEITNTSNAEAVISINAKKLSGVDNPSNSNPSDFTVDYAYPDGMTVAANGGKIHVVVTVTVARVITAATSATFGIELTATAD